MISLSFMRFLKTLMVTTPFFIMIFMVLALWGVGGKASYAELYPAASKPPIEQTECAVDPSVLNKGKQNYKLSTSETKKLGKLGLRVA